MSVGGHFNLSHRARNLELEEKMVRKKDHVRKKRGPEAEIICGWCEFQFVRVLPFLSVHGTRKWKRK